MKKVLFISVLVALVAIFAFADTQYLVTQTTGQYGNTLNLVTTAGPKTYNPLKAKETSSTDIIQLFLTGMIEVDNYGRLLPGLATSWSYKINDDNSVVYTFNLRKGVKWSDGKPFTADDVVFTFKVIEDPKIASSDKDVMKDSQGRLPIVTKIDDYTVQFKTLEPFRPFLRSVGTEYILPKHVLEADYTAGKFDSAWGLDQINRLVGTGPFLPVEYKQGEMIILKKNPNYWKKDKDGKVLPYLDKVVFSIVPDTNAELLKFENGGCDTYGPRASEYPDLKKQASSKGWVVGLDGPTFGTQFITFNWNAVDSKGKPEVARKWFRNLYFRKAVAYALNKQQMIDTIYHGLADAQWGPVSPAAVDFYYPNVYKYPYNLTMAKMNLQLGGFTWKDGKLYDSEGNPVKFSLITNAGNKTREEYCNIITESLKKLGMDVSFSPIDFNTLVGKLLNTGDWEAVVIGLTGGLDPHGGANVAPSYGSLHFWNYSPKAADYVDASDYVHPAWEEEIDNIFKQEVKTLDQTKVKQLFNRYQILYSQYLPQIFLAQQRYMYAYSVKLHNLQPTAYGGMTWNIDRIWKSK
jgi:peptide/nickel transport system substrate-binding protein